MNTDKLKKILASLKIKPNHLKGQNFLIDEAVLNTIIETSAVGRGSTVVEVGPGLGVLTKALLDTGARVIAIEQERQFVDYLRKKFDGSPLSVLAGNAVLKIPELKLPPEYAVVSNLPYSITSPVINLFLSRVPSRPTSLTLMVQREVAERLTAPVGSAERGILTVLIEMLGSARLVARVTPASFYPSPKVESAIIKLGVRGEALGVGEVEKTMRVVKAGFSKRRAQIRNALKLGLKLDTAEVNRILTNSNINPTLRAEDLTVNDWQALARAYYQTPSIVK